jgi:hypothetical protein
MEMADNIVSQFVTDHYLRIAGDNECSIKIWLKNVSVPFSRPCMIQVKQDSYIYHCTLIWKYNIVAMYT